MKYKEFYNWCSDRICNGCWSMNTAIYCLEVIEKIEQESFWKREKIWKKIYENTIVYGIINPINKKIKELERR